MKEGTHEGCIEQIVGLYRDCLLNDNAQTDEVNRYRMDGKETNDATQQRSLLYGTKLRREFSSVERLCRIPQEFLQLLV